MSWKQIVLFVALAAGGVAHPREPEQPGKVEAEVAVATPTATPTPTPTPTPTATATATLTATPTSPGALVEELTVTATRDARRTRDVPQAVSVVGKERITESNMFNVKEVIAGTPGVLIDSKNGGNDARLIIRGAGLKAPYGVREIMVLRDGVPLTDPDSLTRFDWIDTADIERIEIAKGPGNLYSSGAAGGAIQIFSKSVFDDSGNTARAGFGQQGAANLHVRTSGRFGEQAVALTASFRGTENDWRRWNRYQSRQAGLKHGVQLADGGSVESELAYTESSMQLPGSLNQALYDLYRETGKQESSSDVWKHSGRYSTILFFNTKYERTLGDVSLKPRLYYNQWKHVHPVTGAINVSGDWTKNLGTDIEALWRHGGGNLQGTLVAGVTGRMTWNDDVRTYQYRDITVGTSGRITGTLSDARGALAETENQRNTLLGGYLQESLRLWERITADVGLRLDTARYTFGGVQHSHYDYAQGRYVAEATPAVTDTDRSFLLPAPKVGISVAVLPALSVYVSVAQADQVPSSSEIGSNDGLKASRTLSYEAGLKGSGSAWSLEVAAYAAKVKDEIVARVEAGTTHFANAGRTGKEGVEASARVRPGLGLELGLDYAYSDYQYEQFKEVVRGVEQVRDGKRLPFVPVHQIGGSLSWRHAGFRARLQTRSWGSYWMDSANTQTYGGTPFVTSAAAGYEMGVSTLSVQAENLFDQRYSIQTSKDTSGIVTYTPAPPRTVLFSYAYKL